MARLLSFPVPSNPKLVELNVFSDENPDMDYSFFVPASDKKDATAALIANDEEWWADYGDGDWWGITHPECLEMGLREAGIPYTIQYNGEEGRKGDLAMYNTAIIVELDYKGCYSRFALTPNDFSQRYPDAPAPEADGDGYTLRPLVHIWYQKTTINSPRWNEFFTDMYWELSETDLEDDNPAYIDLREASHSLLNDILHTVQTNHASEEAEVLFDISLVAGYLTQQRALRDDIDSRDLCDACVTLARVFESQGRNFYERDYLTQVDEFAHDELLKIYGKEG